MSAQDVRIIFTLGVNDRGPKPGAMKHRLDFSTGSSHANSRKTSRGEDEPVHSQTLARTTTSNCRKRKIGTSMEKLGLERQQQLVTVFFLFFVNTVCCHKNHKNDKNGKNSKNGKDVENWQEYKQHPESSCYMMNLFKSEDHHSSFAKHLHTRCLFVFSRISLPGNSDSLVSDGGCKQHTAPRTFNTCQTLNYSRAHVAQDV